MLEDTCRWLGCIQNSLIHHKAQNGLRHTITEDAFCIKLHWTNTQEQKPSWQYLSMFSSDSTVWLKDSKGISHVMLRSCWAVGILWKSKNFDEDHAMIETRHEALVDNCAFDVLSFHHHKKVEAAWKNMITTTALVWISMLKELTTHVCTFSAGKPRRQNDSKRTQVSRC